MMWLLLLKEGVFDLLKVFVFLDLLIGMNILGFPVYLGLRRSRCWINFRFNYGGRECCQWRCF